MRAYQKIIASGLILAGLAGLLGCDNKSKPKSKEIEESQSYFAELPMYSESGMAMATGDFDGDGDLDLIVGVRSYGYEARLYKFTNDGKGNLSQ